MSSRDVVLRDNVLRQFFCDWCNDIDSVTYWHNGDIRVTFVGGVEMRLTPDQLFNWIGFKLGDKKVEKT